MKGSGSVWRRGRPRPPWKSLLISMFVAGVTSTSFAANVPAGWKVYRSREFGFEIAYPKDAKFSLAESNDGDTPPSTIPVCEESTVACVQPDVRQYEGTRLRAAGLSVNILRDLRTEKQCASIDTGQYPIRKTTIHEVPFHFGETGGVAAGTVDVGTSYRTFHENICFELRIRLVFDNTAHDPDDIKEISTTELQNRIHRVLRTFRFVTKSP